jgi:hypothetical protein
VGAHHFVRRQRKHEPPVSHVGIPTGALTEEQIATAKRLDIYGTIQREILAAWHALSE